MATIDDGIIRRDEFYTLSAFKKRLGIADRAWWEMRESGLPTVRIGTKIGILGSMFLDWAEKHSHGNASQSRGARGKKASRAALDRPNNGQPTPAIGQDESSGEGGA